MNIHFDLVRHMLFGNSYPVTTREGMDDLFENGLTMGTLIIGRPGTGKTSALARHIVDKFLTHPEHSIFVLDWSGAITDAILALILQQPESARENAVKRLIYDEFGNRDWVMPLPEFSEAYGSYEDQVQRVSTNLAKLAPSLVENAPVLGGLGLREIAPQIFRLLCATTNDHDESWQITEAKKMVMDEGLARRALKIYGYKVPEAKYFLEKIFLEIKPTERELRTYALLAMLGVIEPREIRARIGFYRPGWTPKEAIEKGMMIIVNGAPLINQPNAQHYLFTQAYSLIMAEINRRIPGNPADNPVSLVMDEVYSLISIPGMAKEIGLISPLYRSRKLQLYVVLQSLSQLAEPLDEQIWTMGNKVVFALENKTEAEQVAHQLFRYDPRYTKQLARTAYQNPITEPENGQDRLIADWIQSLRFRECLMRRFISERQAERIITHVSRTKENPANVSMQTLFELKDNLLRTRAVRVRDALEVINQRYITFEEARRHPPSV